MMDYGLWIMDYGGGARFAFSFLLPLYNPPFTYPKLVCRLIKNNCSSLMISYTLGPCALPPSMCTEFNEYDVADKT